MNNDTKRKPSRAVALKAKPAKCDSIEWARPGSIPVLIKYCRAKHMLAVSVMLNTKYLLNLLMITEESKIPSHIDTITADKIAGRLIKLVGKITNIRLKAKKPPATAASFVSAFEILYRKGISDIK